MINPRERLKTLLLGRAIYRLLTTVGFSASTARSVTRFIRIILGFPKYTFRKLYGYVYRRSNPTNLLLDFKAGCGILKLDDLAHGVEVKKSCERILEDKLNAVVPEGGSSGKYYRAELLDFDDLRLYPEILEFATGPEIISAVTKYLGTYPVLADIRLWLTQSNMALQSAQLYHIDQEDFRQIKIFININEVTTLNGPVTAIKADGSERLSKNVAHPLTRISDTDVDFYVPDRADYLELAGPPGTVGYVDTSRCFHMGSRTRQGRRVTLVLSYMRYPVIRELTKSIFRGHSGFGNNLSFSVKHLLTRP